jgi:tetratricopeptide (TPR) repeat protein
VSNEVWQKFGERLAVAESALTRAWELNPKEPRIAYAMMPVELGQGKGRDRMEFWFQRAMKLNTNYAYACYSKLYYLEPKWYGSVDDMLAFGRECVHSTNWGGHVPLMLLEAHQAIQREYVDDSRKANYWKQPDVWQDLKAAFDRFFQLNPTETSWYNNYALYAYKAERWDALSKIIPKIVNVNYECFGDKEDYDKMVAETKTHVGVGTAD